MANLGEWIYIEGTESRGALSGVAILLMAVNSQRKILLPLKAYHILERLQSSEKWLKVTKAVSVCKLAEKYGDVLILLQNLAFFSKGKYFSIKNLFPFCFNSIPSYRDFRICSPLEAVFLQENLPC